MTNFLKTQTKENRIAEVIGYNNKHRKYRRKTWKKMKIFITTQNIETEILPNVYFSTQAANFNADLG